MWIHIKNTKYQNEEIIYFDHIVSFIRNVSDLVIRSHESCTFVEYPVGVSLQNIVETLTEYERDLGYNEILDWDDIAWNGKEEEEDEEKEDPDDGIELDELAMKMAYRYVKILEMKKREDENK